jgi:hypothetical protein
LANTVNFVVKNGLTVGSNVVIAANGTYYGAIANTGVTSGTYGGSSNVAVITVNSAGQITSVSNTSVTATATIVSNVDTFTGNGSTVAFTLTQTPYNTNSTIVNINGAVQQKSTYSLSGNVVTLTEAPRSGANIEITTLYNAGGSGTITGALVSTTDTFTGNGSATAYTLTVSPISTNYVFVNIDGVQQQRANYSLVGSTLTFTTAPPNTSKIEITSLTSASGAVIGLTTFGGSNNAVYSSSANTLVAGTLPVTAGGTGVTSSSGANSVVLRDTNQNVVFNNYAPGLTSTSTASGTTTLSVSSSHFQRFTGTLNQTVKLPDETTVPAGQSYVIDNDSTGTITLQDSAGGSLGNIVPGMAGYLYNENNSAATGNWSGYMYVPGAGPGGQITWGTSGLSMGNQTITNSIWNGSTINVAYGGTNNSSYTTGALLQYNGSGIVSIANTGVTSGNYGGSTQIPVLNIDAYGRVTSASNTSITSGTTLTDDTTTATTHYPLLTVSTSGSISIANTSSSKLTYVPSTGILSATGFTGSGSTLTNIPAANVTGTLTSTVLGNSTVYIGSTAIALNRATASQSLTGVSIDGSAATFTSTTQNSQFNSIGVNTAASGTAGEIRATNNITAGYSDDKLKTKLGNITNALEKLLSINGFYYEPNETAIGLGYKQGKQVGVSAQEMQKVLPEVVVPAPIDDKYLTVQYEKIIPLLIEAIKAQQIQIDALTQKVK